MWTPCGPGVGVAFLGLGMPLNWRLASSEINGHRTTTTPFYVSQEDILRRCISQETRLSYYYIQARGSCSAPPFQIPCGRFHCYNAATA
ncbi:hypothetical protein DFH09DRAFT_1125729 [Mycena vulgaris]|nr:hypothetical protein DFH09DRAFT_1125729 [Mycena vulgaris]